MSQYRLTSGHWIGQIISEEKYKSLDWTQKFVFEKLDVGQADHYQFRIDVVNKIRNKAKLVHVFDFESEVKQFIELSGWFGPKDAEYFKNNLDEALIEIETSTAVITYTRK